jgi:hypothetical protein
VTLIKCSLTAFCGNENHVSALLIPVDVLLTRFKIHVPCQEAVSSGPAARVKQFFTVKIHISRNGIQDLGLIRTNCAVAKGHEIWNYM